MLSINIRQHLHSSINQIVLRGCVSCAIDRTIGFPVQPIVGKDADDKIISYRPPELFRLELVPDADNNAQQKDEPAGIPSK